MEIDSLKHNNNNNHTSNSKSHLNLNNIVSSSLLATNNPISGNINQNIFGDDNNEQKETEQNNKNSITNSTKEMVGGCAVCGQDEGFLDNVIIYCDSDACGFGVHQACYGITKVPPKSQDWFCAPCSVKQKPERCELCPAKYGAFKPTKNGKWCHVVCALYIPEITFGCKNKMEPIFLDKIDIRRVGCTCILCEMNGRDKETSRSGCCMSCHYPNCPNKFHVTCAQYQGFLCEESSHSRLKYKAYCPQHIEKLRNSRRAKIKILPPYRPEDPNRNQSNSFIMLNEENENNQSRPTLNLPSTPSSVSSISPVMSRSRRTFKANDNGSYLSDNMVDSANKKERKRKNLSSAKQTKSSFASASTSMSSSFNSSLSTSTSSNHFSTINNSLGNNQNASVASSNKPFQSKLVSPCPNELLTVPRNLEASSSSSTSTTSNSSTSCSSSDDDTASSSDSDSENDSSSASSTKESLPKNIVSSSNLTTTPLKSTLILSDEGTSSAEEDNSVLMDKRDYQKQNTQTNCSNSMTKELNVNKSTKKIPNDTINESSLLAASNNNLNKKNLKLPSTAMANSQIQSFNDNKTKRYPNAVDSFDTEKRITKSAGVISQTVSVLKKKLNSKTNSSKTSNSRKKISSEESSENDEMSLDDNDDDDDDDDDDNDVDDEEDDDVEDDDDDDDDFKINNKKRNTSKVSPKITKQSSRASRYSSGSISLLNKTETANSSNNNRSKTSKNNTNQTISNRAPKNSTPKPRNRRSSSLKSQITDTAKKSPSHLVPDKDTNQNKNLVKEDNSVSPCCHMISNQNSCNHCNYTSIGNCNHHCLPHALPSTVVGNHYHHHNLPLNTGNCCNVLSINTENSMDNNTGNKNGTDNNLLTTCNSMPTVSGQPQLTGQQYLSNNTSRPQIPFSPLMIPCCGTNIAPSGLASPLMELPSTSKSLEELLEFQWIHTSHFLMGNEENKDASLLLQKLHSLMSEKKQRQKELKLLQEKKNYFDSTRKLLKEMLILNKDEQEEETKQLTNNDNNCDNNAVNGFNINGSAPMMNEKNIPVTTTSASVSYFSKQNETLLSSQQQSNCSNILMNSNLSTSVNSNINTQTNTSLNNIIATTRLESNENNGGRISRRNSSNLINQINSNDLSVPSQPNNLINNNNDISSSMLNSSALPSALMGTSNNTNVNKPAIPDNYSEYLCKTLYSGRNASQNLPSAAGFTENSTIGYSSGNNLSSTSSAPFSNFEQFIDTNLPKTHNPLIHNQHLPQSQQNQFLMNNNTPTGNQFIPHHYNDQTSTLPPQVSHNSNYRTRTLRSSTTANLSNIPNGQINAIASDHSQQQLYNQSTAASSFGSTSHHFNTPHQHHYYSK